MVGDRPDDLRQSLDFFARTGVDLIITSGGLGPTADDLTAELVGEFQGRHVRARSPTSKPRSPRSSPGCRPGGAGGSTRTRPPPPPASRRSSRAAPPCWPRSAPRPAWSSRSPTGEADRRSSCCPARRASCRACGPTRWPTRASRPRCSGRAELRQRTIRLWGTPESELAATMREHDSQLGRPGDHHLPARRRARDRHPVRRRPAGRLRRLRRRHRDCAYADTAVLRRRPHHRPARRRRAARSAA